MYIDGQWCEAIRAKRFDVTNPATGEVIGSAPDGDENDTIAAIEAAHAAFASWSKTTPHQRSEILYRAHDLMLKNQGELAELLSKEQGKAYKFAAVEVKYAADFLLWFAEQGKRIYGRTIPSARPDQRFLVQYHPVGVVGAITPWNYPISMLTRKLAPALAAGCTAVLKPAETTPLIALETFNILEQAGVPKGVINLVTTSTPGPVGDTLISHPNVSKITFTGSTAVGKQLAAGAAMQMKKISLELGGHAPFIVMKDADPVHAAKGAALVKFLNTGQACISPNRIYVHRDALDAFVSELHSRVGKLKIGEGLDKGVTIGPLNNEQAVKKMETQVSDALTNGAQLISGGERATNDGLDKGHFFQPTILTNVSPAMRIYREETFGPIAAIVAYDDEDDLIAMANDTEYGLAAYVYTQNLSEAYKMIEALRFGIIGINDINPTAAAVPFGGMQTSGYGREGGDEGLLEYLEVKTAGISIS